MSKATENGFMPDKTHNAATHEMNPDSYSHESGEMEMDPFAEHYGELSSEVQGLDGGYN